MQKVAFTTVLVGCACQLTSRIMLYRAYERTEYMIKSASHPHIIIPLNDITSSVGRSPHVLLVWQPSSQACCRV